MGLPGIGLNNLVTSNPNYTSQATNNASHSIAQNVLDSMQFGTGTSAPAQAPAQAPAHNPTPVINQTPAAPAYNQADIDAIDASLKATLARYIGDYTKAQTDNKAYDATAANSHTSQVNSNDQSHEQAIHNALTAAALGSQGLRSVLASLGALGGTGSVLANRAVANSANNDIGGADQTYQTNANQIGSAWTDTTNAEKKRDDALNQALRDNKTSARNQAVQSKMDIYNKAGATSLYDSLLPQLTKTAVAPTTIAASPTVYNPAAVNQFAPTSKLNVTANGGATSPTNSALFAVKKKLD